MRISMLIAALLLSAPHGAAAAGALESAAVLDGKAITQAGLATIVGDQDFRLRTERYEIQRKALQQYIDGQVLAREAAARNTTPGALLEELVRSAVAPVTEADISGVLAEQPTFAQGLDADGVRRVLEQRRADATIRKFMRTLRAKADARILLEAPRAEMNLSLSHGIGPERAPVTVVVFSDFACPACGRFEKTASRLRELYPLELRIVYRTFPVSLRPAGAKAAEAVLCADAQGKYWEMHRRLFQEGEPLTAASVGTHAHELGLDESAFAECLAKGEQEARWRRDVADGTRLGVEVTPTVFVNGRLLLEAPSEESLREAIREELE